jgi:hypothetical protein
LKNIKLDTKLNLQIFILNKKKSTQHEYFLVQTSQIGTEILSIWKSHTENKITRRYENLQKYLFYSWHLCTKSEQIVYVSLAKNKQFILGNQKTAPSMADGDDNDLQNSKKNILGHTRRFVLILYNDAKNTKFSEDCQTIAVLICSINFCKFCRCSVAR